MAAVDQFQMVFSGGEVSGHLRRKWPTFVFGGGFFQVGGEGPRLVIGGRWLAGGE
jgi:hypothetical protein